MVVAHFESFLNGLGRFRVCAVTTKFHLSVTTLMVKISTHTNSRMDALLTVA